MLKIIAKQCYLARLLVVMLVAACFASLLVIFNSTILDRRIPINNQLNKSAVKEKPKNELSSIVEKYKSKVGTIVTTPDYIVPNPKNGLAPLISTIPTKQPVVFLGIDDGVYKDASEVQMLKDNNIKASLFLAKSLIVDNPNFFKQITANGSFIENHTLNHYLDLYKRSYAVQKAEICGQADYLQAQYGRRPVLYRPPGGSYDSDTLRAANDCGMKAVATWIAKANGGSMQYQIGNKLRPGDIVLMHFRPEFKQDLQAFIDAEKASGLHTALLEDWVSQGSFE